MSGPYLSCCSHQRSSFCGDSSHRGRGRESWMEKGKEETSSRPGAGPEQAALSHDHWGLAAALAPQVQGCARPPAEAGWRWLWGKVLPGFLGCRAVGSPGLHARAEWLILSENKCWPCLQVCLCLLLLPGAFCSPPPGSASGRLSPSFQNFWSLLRNSSQEQRAPGSPRRRMGFCLSKCTLASASTVPRFGTAAETDPCSPYSTVNTPFQWSVQ